MRTGDVWMLWLAFSSPAFQASIFMLSGPLPESAMTQLFPEKKLQAESY